MPHVSIGPEFFAKARNDYSDWRWALVREFMQNGIDAGSRLVGFSAEVVGQTTVVTVENDGDPMTEDVLVNKLLSLGSSGKKFEGTVGGFGKAKELLYFCWLSYTIETGSLVVKGAGAEYTLSKAKKPFAGTRSRIVLPGDHVSSLREEAGSFIRLANVGCRFTVNGRAVESVMKKGYFRRDLPFGKVYTNQQAPNVLVVRIGGIPMYTQYIQYKGCVVLELDGVSSDVLTSNRDGLRSEQWSAVDAFVADLTTNKRKALKQKVTEYLRYDGNKVRCAGFDKQAAKTAPTADAAAEAAAEAGPALGVVMGDTRYNAGDLVVEGAAARARHLASAFIIKNETGRQVKRAYRPDSERFGRHAYRTIMIWTKLLIKMHELFAWEDEFTVGFIFTDNEVVAQFERTPDHGKVYYINPVKITNGRWAKRFSISFNKAREDLDQLAITALHELAHGMGFSDHDEEYANKLTDMAGKLLRHYKELLACYRND